MSFSTDPVEGLTQFFDTIWGSVDGFVYLPVKDQTNTWKKNFFPWPKAKRNIIDYVLANAAQSKDVYFSPAVWEKPSLERSSIKGSNVVWADFDGSYPDEWTTPRPQAGSEAPGAVPGHPSVTVQSSTESHQHVYWKLDEFNTDLDRIQEINRAIAYTYKADSSGWDAEQILRPPFTTNHKRGLPVLISSFDDTTYPVDDFSHFKSVKQLVREAVDIENLPDPVTVIGKYVWEPDTLDLINKPKEELNIDRSAGMMRIAYTAAEKGLSDAEAYSILLWIDDRWEKFKQRGDRQRRLLDMINKARQKYPHKIEDPTFDGLRGKLTPVAVDIKVVYNFGEFLATDISVDWVVKDLISEQSINLIAGPANVGKTQLAINLATHVALSKMLVGYQPLGRRKNLFLSLEMGPGLLHRLLGIMAKGYTDAELQVLSKNFFVAPLGESIPIHRPEGRKFVESVIEEYEPEGIYIDSLGKVLLGDLNNDEKVREFFAYLSALRAKYGTHFVIVHHTRKPQEGNKRPRELGDIYGSQYITSEPDSVLSLWPEEKNIISVREVKNRMAEKQDTFSIQRVEHLGFMRYDNTEMAIEQHGLSTSTDPRRQPGAMFGF